MGVASVDLTRMGLAQIVKCKCSTSRCFEIDNKLATFITPTQQAVAVVRVT